MKTFDVVVVGAGPAGGHCARKLAKLGYKVLLAERHDTFEKNDFSSAATPLETLSQFDLPSEVVGSFWNRLVVETPKEGQSWNSPETLGAVLNFAKLRTFLANEVKQNGGEVWLGYCYKQHTSVNGKTCVEFQASLSQERVVVNTRVLVDATGFSRAVIYEKGTEKPEFVTGIGIEYLIEVESEVYRKYANSLVFFLGNKWCSQGYSWIFPMEENRLKVGSCHLYGNSQAAKPKKPLKDYIDLLISEYLKIEYFKIIDKHGSTMKYSSDLQDIYYKNNVVAIGDAVSTINILGGEGIRHGMYGAEIASKYIYKCLENQIGDFRGYQQEMHQLFIKKWNFSEKLALRKYLEDDRDMLTYRAISFLKYMKIEDVIDILFYYKFEKLYQGFRRYLKYKVNILFQRLKQLIGN